MAFFTKFVICNYVATVSIILFPSTLDKALNDPYYINNVLGHKNSDRSSSVRPSSDSIYVTHKSTVARTVMCRQDGRGRFPVLLDDHSKCRTNSQRKSQLS